MGKIIVLVGSVRKGGNTQLLAEAFAEGARQYHAVELVYIAQQKIAPCTGRELVFDKNVRGELSLKYRVIAA